MTKIKDSTEKRVSFFFFVLNFSILFLFLIFFHDSCLLHSGKYEKRVSKQKENEDPERWDKKERVLVYENHLHIMMGKVQDMMFHMGTQFKMEEN